MKLLAYSTEDDQLDYEAEDSINAADTPIWMKKYLSLNFYIYHSGFYVYYLKLRKY